MLHLVITLMMRCNITVGYPWSRWHQCWKGYLDEIRARTKGVINEYRIKCMLDGILVDVSCPLLAWLVIMV